MTDAYGPVAVRVTGLDHAESDDVGAHESSPEPLDSGFVERFPQFESDAPTRWSVGQIREPRALPIRLLATT